jgi:anion-transporting  ArsA/GET3 family ATPase
VTSPPSLRPAVDAAAVVVCCGAGGVGKTTAAAAIAIESARRGRRAIVVTIDPARRLADALGLPDGLAATPTRIELQGFDVVDDGGELWAMMLDTAAAFDDVVRRYATSPEQAERIVANPFFQKMSVSLSGTQEYMAAETLYLLHQDERFDLVVVDTPPTRNALDFLAAPGVLSRFLDHRVFKLMMLPAQRGLRVVGVAAQPMLRLIGRVVGSEVLADAVAFFQAFAGMEAGFRQRAQAVIGLLRSDSTHFVVVTSPRAEAVDEAVWFAEQLDAQGIAARSGVVNRVTPAFGDGTVDDAVDAAEHARTSGAEPTARLWDNLAELRADRAAELDELGSFAGRFGDGTVVEVPLLPSDVHDIVGLEHVGRHLFP